MAALPLAVQLYSVREAAEENFDAAVRRIADMGYAGVELAGVYGDGGPADGAKFIRSLGLEIPSAHIWLPDDDNPAPAIAAATALGASYWVVPYMNHELWTTRDGLAKTADRLNRAATTARAAGVTLLYHNHDFEFRPIPELDGLTPFEVILPLLDPAVGFEIDLYWAQVGGSDPAATLSRLGDRARLLHMKDGPVNREEAMVAVGSGQMQYPAILSNARAEWLIVELDRTDGDVFEAIDQSYGYLTREGYAHGRA